MGMCKNSVAHIARRIQITMAVNFKSSSILDRKGKGSWDFRCMTCFSSERTKTDQTTKTFKKTSISSATYLQQLHRPGSPAPFLDKSAKEVESEISTYVRNN